MGLIALSYRFYLLRVLRILMAPKGLAAGFFHWQKTTLSLLRREAGLLMVTFLPAIFITQISLFRQFSRRRQSYLGSASVYRFLDHPGLLLLPCTPSQDRGVAAFFG